MVPLNAVQVTLVVQTMPGHDVWCEHIEVRNFHDGTLIALECRPARTAPTPRAVALFASQTVREHLDAALDPEPF